MCSFNSFLAKLKEISARKVEVQDLSKFRLFFVGLILIFAVLIIVLKTADFSKVNTQQSVLKSGPPPPPPPELLTQPDVQGEQMVLGDAPGVPASCYDFNGDGVVGEADARVVLNYFGSRRGDNRYVDQYDLDHNGAINMTDVLMVTAQNGRTCFDIVPTPTPYMDVVPSDLKVNLDMGCSASINAQMVIFSWKPARNTDVGWTLYISDNNWQTLHWTRRFQISGDRTFFGWSTANPTDDGFVPAFGKSYKWRVSSFVMTVNGPDFRTPACPTPTPKPPSPPPPTLTPSPIGCFGPLKIMSVSLNRSGLQQYVVTQVDNLQNCNGIPVWVVIKTDTWNWQACTVSGNGCSTRHLLPKPGTYPIFAVADLDKDGTWYEPGEYDKRTLTVN